MAAPHIEQRLEGLSRRMRGLIEKRKWREGIGVLRQAKALADDLDPSFYNNCALCHEALGDARAALETLAPNLGAKALPSPFAHALAAKLLHALDREAEAGAQYREAVADFEQGLSLSGGRLPESWREYLVIMQTAAGKMGRHREVIDLHRRWEHLYATNQNYFLVGVAAFNLGRFRQAAAFWRSVSDDGWGKTLSAYAIVASEIDRGLIPRFVLPYHLPEEGKLTKKALPKYEPSDLVLMLAMFAENGYAEDEMIGELCVRTGDWGERFARNLTKDAKAPEPTKMAALKALVDLGRHPANEPFTIVVNGHPKQVVIRTMEIRDQDQEAARIVDQAIALRDAGRADEAEKALRALLDRGIIYPPALLTLANLLRTREKLTEAATLFKALIRIAPDDPTVLFNRCGLHLQMREWDEAREVFARIDPAGQDGNFREKYRELKRTFREQAMFSSMFDPDVIARRYREEQDAKEIPLHLQLVQGLRRVPADWLTAACQAHGLEPARHKAERIKQLAEHIAADPGRAAARVSAETRECLGYLLNQGGWAKLPMVERRFGTMEEDGFWWSEKPPQSLLGQLRLYGLVFVGRAWIEERRYKVAIVPKDLRAELTAEPRKEPVETPRDDKRPGQGRLRLVK